MNTGVVISRYAEALLKYAAESEDADVICTQALTLEKALGDYPKLREALSNPVACTPGQKMSLLRAALGGDMDAHLEAFAELVIRKGRASMLRMMLHAFADRYFHMRNIVRASLVTAVPSDELEKKVSDIVGNLTGGRVMIDSRVDPSLIGGFILTIDDKRIDASVKGRLESFRRQFVEQNKRQSDYVAELFEAERGV